MISNQLKKKMHMEKWKELPPEYGSYLVSNLGNVKSLPKVKYCMGGKYLTSVRILVPGLVNGYHKVLLYNNGSRRQYSIHRLVCIAFYGPDESKSKVVNHIDGNKLNNRLENLEWATESENTIHAHKTGLAKPYKRTEASLDKLRKSLCKKVINTESGVVYNSISEACKVNNIKPSYLSQMLTGKVANKTQLRYHAVA